MTTNPLHSCSRLGLNCRQAVSQSYTTSQAMFTTLILIVFVASSINQLGAARIMDKELNEFQFVNVGVVLNLNSSVGSISDKCLSMALDDFYVLKYDYKTRVVLHKKHTEDVSSTALSVLDLLESDQVVAIIGSQSLIEGLQFLQQKTLHSHISK
ncbi:hypothetical protein QQ045_014899 [Rhodiola kirilowii]